MVERQTMVEIEKELAEYMKMRQSLNLWNDGMNEHISGPISIERATELIRWADSQIFRLEWENAKLKAMVEPIPRGPRKYKD